LGTGELIGSTDISLENRLYARQWQSARRPTERRPLLASKKGRMPQGFIEVCLDIFPETDAGLTPYHYLLSVIQPCTPLSFVDSYTITNQ
jgi:hypothetical protein